MPTPSLLAVPPLAVVLLLLLAVVLLLLLAVVLLLLLAVVLPPLQTSTQPGPLPPPPLLRALTNAISVDLQNKPSLPSASLPPSSEKKWEGIWPVAFSTAFCRSVSRCNFLYFIPS
jgi:hypothetical protein